MKIQCGVRGWPSRTGGQESRSRGLPSGAQNICAQGQGKRWGVADGSVFPANLLGKCGVPLGLPNMNNYEAGATASFAGREIVTSGPRPAKGLYSLLGFNPSFCLIVSPHNLG